MVDLPLTGLKTELVPHANLLDSFKAHLRGGLFCHFFLTLPKF